MRIDPQSHDEIRPDYVDRINRGIDQIVQHLDSPLKLDQVSTESEVSRDSRLEQSALDWLYGTWLPESGHEPDDLPCFEAWYGHPFGHGFEHFELSVQLPVRQ